MFTPTETCMLELLADGKPHTRRELHACLPDELGGLVNVRRHLCNIRRKLTSRGEAVICVLHLRRICYQRVRVLVPPDGPVSA